MNILFLTNNLDTTKPLYEFLKSQKDLKIFLFDKKLDKKTLSSLKISLAISYNYSSIISQELIDCMKGKIINLHISYLPYNRGADPNIWSILDETPSGVTIHLIDRGLDTGKILFQKRCYFSRSSTLRSSYNILHKEIQQLFKSNWSKIKNFEFIAKKQKGTGSFHLAKEAKKFPEIMGREGYDIKISEFKMRYNQRIKSERKKMMVRAKNVLKDDFGLLDLMLKDSKIQPPLYRPGPYWKIKTRIVANEIKRCGLKNFRGSSNLIGLSYADNLAIDIRDSMNFNLVARLVRWVTKAYPLNKIFNKQVQWTQMYASRSIIYAQEILNLKKRSNDLVKKYKIPYTLLGNCISKAQLDSQDLSVHYLDLLEQHDNISEYIRFDKAKSVFEIGGGFGANIHLLLENYKNIKKILYLDIPPNLYVGTQYLKALYPNAVTDYRELKKRDSIKFSPNNKLEIFCIAPWQIEKFEDAIDIFINSHSFVEMPKGVVKNYVDNFSRFHGSDDSAVALSTYDCFDLNTTLNPKSLPKFFKGRKFINFTKQTLLDSTRENHYFLSEGKFSAEGSLSKK